MSAQCRRLWEKPRVLLSKDGHSYATAWNVLWLVFAVELKWIQD